MSSSPKRNMAAKINMLTFFTVAFTSLTEAMEQKPVSHEVLSRDVQVMKNLDINMYLGTWYEQASNVAAKSTFELGCICTTAEYSLNPGSTTVDVHNSCRRIAFTNVRGKAYPVSPVSEDGIIEEARFKVDFAGSGPPSQGDPGNYWVLWTDYNYAIVGGPVPFKRLFFLSRARQITDEEIASMHERALDAGVLPVELLPPLLLRTNQDPHHCRDEAQTTS